MVEIITGLKLKSANPKTRNGLSSRITRKCPRSESECSRRVYTHPSFIFFFSNCEHWKLESTVVPSCNLLYPLALSQLSLSCGESMPLTNWPNDIVSRPVCQAHITYLQCQLKKILLKSESIYELVHLFIWHPMKRSHKWYKRNKSASNHLVIFAGFSLKNCVHFEDAGMFVGKRWEHKQCSTMWPFSTSKLLKKDWGNKGDGQEQMKFTRALV